MDLYSAFNIPVPLCNNRTPRIGYMAYVVCSDYEWNFSLSDVHRYMGIGLIISVAMGWNQDAYCSHKKEGCIKILDTSLDMVFGQILTKRGGGV